MYPKFVKIVEVSPRDRLQNEPSFITKPTLIHMLADCGLR